MPLSLAGAWPVARRKSAPEPEQATPVVAGNSLADRMAEVFAEDSDRMIWDALMGCRLGTDDKILNGIIAEHRKCPRGYCDHRAAVDRYSEAIGWDE